MTGSSDPFLTPSHTFKKDLFIFLMYKNLFILFKQCPNCMYAFMLEEGKREREREREQERERDSLCAWVHAWGDQKCSKDLSCLGPLSRLG